MSHRDRTRPAAPRASTAKVFWSGRSQAVRLPKEFRLASAEVTVRRDGERLVLEPLAIARDARGWPTAWWDLAGAAPELDLGRRDARPERTDPLGRRRRAPR